MGHGGKGRRQNNLPVIPGLPVPGEDEVPATPPGARVEQFWAAGPSMSQFMVPARASYKRARKLKGRRAARRLYGN